MAPNHRVPTAEVITELECEESKYENFADLPLGELARIIKAHVRGALRHAIAAGEALNAAKGLLAHGEWLPFLAEQCDGLSSRTAQHYMRVAANREAVEKAGATTMQAALAAIPRQIRGVKVRETVTRYTCGPVQVRTETAPPQKYVHGPSDDRNKEADPVGHASVAEIKPPAMPSIPIDESQRQAAIALAFFKKAVGRLAESYRKLPPEVRREAFEFVFARLWALTPPRDH